MNEAIDKLLPLERNLFFALDGSDSQFLDNVMWMLSGRLVWIPLFLFILFLFFYKSNWKEGLLVTLFFILVFALCDQLASSFFKPVFERFRPTHHPDFKELVDIVNGYRGGRYGFISSHATNSFGLAVFLSLLFRHRRVTISVLCWAVLNSYTRIYLGVHFVSDILAGMIVGSLVGLLLYKLYRLSRAVLLHAPASQNTLLYSQRHATLLSLFIPAYVLILVFFSSFLATLPH
ncbi:MAG: phosphatase PAP2 family protein [Porphyromonadaceae bacterium]|nr:phosphatase PAP2 family protein [Porphyromonadaceae bacterium]